MRKLMLATILAFALFAFAGCTYDELRFVNAVQQMNVVDSFESETQIALEVQFSGGTKEFHEMMLEVQELLDNLTISTSSRQENLPNGSRTSTDLTASLLGEEISLAMWQHLCHDENISYTVVRIPEFVLGIFFPEKNAVNYIIQDNSSSLDDEMLMLVSTVLSWMRTPFDPQDESPFMQVVNLWETSFVSSHLDENGQTVLTLSVTDEQLFDAFMTFMYRLYTDETARGHVTDLLLQFAAFINEPVTESREELMDELQDLAAEVLDVSVRSLADITLSGENSFVYSITLDENGNIYSGYVSLDLRLDSVINALASTYRLMGGSFGTDVVETFSVTFRAETQYSNIGTAPPVVFPTVNEGNSISFEDLVRLPLR